MDQTEFTRLLQKYLDGTATTMERRTVDALLDALKETSEPEDIDPETFALRKRVMHQRLMAEIEPAVVPLYRRGGFVPPPCHKQYYGADCAHYATGSGTG